MAKGGTWGCTAASAIAFCCPFGPLAGLILAPKTRKVYQLGLKKAQPAVALAKSSRFFTFLSGWHGTARPRRKQGSAARR